MGNIFIYGKIITFFGPQYFSGSPNKLLSDIGIFYIPHLTVYGGVQLII